MVKKIVFIRHAHRDTSDRAIDNGLSAKGRKQAIWLNEFFCARFSKQRESMGVWLVSSPKVRCVETLTPIAQSWGREVDTHPLLLEQGLRESSDSLQLRIKKFLAEWHENEVELTVVCSHGDWLPLAVHQLAGISIGFKKGSWVEFEAEPHQLALRWLISNFKHFA